VVDKAKDYIRAGDIFQVVASHRFRAPFPLEPFALYRSLRRTNPSPFLFFLDLDGFNLVGSSPEILVRLRDGKITIRPIAGTRPRGATPEEDLALEKELLADPKERSEHLMLLDLGRNDVGRVAMLKHAGSNDPAAKGKHANVRVTDSFKIERYSHVMHIVSNVEGDAPEGVDPVDVLMAALPAGTLSGAPKVRAMEIIDELESREARHRLRRRGRLYRRRRLGRHLHRAAHGPGQGRHDVRPGRRRHRGRQRPGRRVRRDPAQVAGPEARGRRGLAFR
jgi:anthranilate synthase component 1